MIMWQMFIIFSMVVIILVIAIIGNKDYYLKDIKRLIEDNKTLKVRLDDMEVSKNEFKELCHKLSNKINEGDSERQIKD